MNVKQCNERKKHKAHRCLVVRRKVEVNSSKLDILCKLIQQNLPNSILDCKNKIEKLQDRKIMSPGIDMNWRVT